ncbi:MAG: histidine phosphatase family protein [Bacteroidales bacterium]|nr:histidine phosphatase family protein [Bacteroidales bacterium]MCF8343776.1 histidine phosphatase family protein [Bacteroidales bacterium]MCF8350300.1 histidine phosphatase family protein [Bacteroidales bacterium]MCF8374739.1 histidine phosphatase family protein [Bacteroidales bacterium]MCF8399857.1 histidine phosphatase family protein [Bacteroidales bacterium]
MKTLYIVRHAKSSWDYPDLTDHDRPLLEKGKKRTKKIIDFILDKSIQVDYIISSSAVRALETAKFLARAMRYPVEDIKVDPQVYHADAEKLKDQFFDLSDKYNSVMLFGHNPAFTNFANFFLEEKIDWLPTSGIVCIDFETEKWDQIFIAVSHTKFIITPKMLKASENV